MDSLTLARQSPKSPAAPKLKPLPAHLSRPKPKAAGETPAKGAHAVGSVSKLKLTPKPLGLKQPPKMPSWVTGEDEERLSGPLLQYLKDKNIPPEMWEDTAADIERMVGKKLAAAVARPLWDDRARYPDLANVSAPEFLKRVWADQIGADGTIEKELVRQNDRSLMAKVDAYLGMRKARDQDAGDAEGLRFIARPTGRKANEPR